MKNCQKYSAPFLRLVMSAVFLWFGANQVFDTASWTGYVPLWIDSLGLTPETIVTANGIAEIVLGLMLALGIYVRLAAVLLALHLAGIAFTIGYNSTGIRDLGLALATFAVALHGPDQCSIKK